MKEGVWLGSNPDLARTYFEVGKQLLSPHSKFKKLNGISAKKYLNKATELFEEFDLQWDLNEAEKVLALN
jgi:hypothetical protein